MYCRADEIYDNISTLTKQAQDIRAQIRGLKKEHIRTLNDMPYCEYLKTKHWQRMKKRALKRAKNACQMCMSAPMIKCKKTAIKK